MYDEIILDHYKHPRNFGTVVRPTTTCHVNNPLCGDKINMTAIIEKGVIQEVKFEAEGCAISIASASLLSEYLQGTSIADLRKLDSSFILKLLNIELSPNRLKCALLPLEAAQKLQNT